MKIHAPNPHYTGTDLYGTETVLDFHDGVAEYAGDLPPGVKAYLHSAGYGVGRKPKAAEPEVLEVPDPRDGTEVQLGNSLRDAAVDPRPGDFLAPINAGKEGPEGNPHGTNVVAPELHAGTTGAVALGRQLDAGEPKGGAKREEWVEFARSQGAPETELGELGTEGALSRDDLRAKYGS